MTTTTVHVQFSLFENRWYWCDFATKTFDALHPWPHAAIAEVENDGSGFAVKGADIINGLCTITTYKAKKDGQTHEVILDGWHPPGALATRLMTFGQLTMFKARTDYDDRPIYEQVYQEAKREAEAEEEAKRRAALARRK